jgi:hypothetical protein
LAGLFQAVLDQQVEVVTLVQDLADDAGIELHQAPRFAVLLGDELLVQRRDLNIEIEFGQIEIRRKAARWVAMPVPFDVEGGWFVLPSDLIEVEQLCELPLAVVGESDALVRKGGGRLC